MSLQNDTSWFAKEQKRRLKSADLPTPEDHISQAQDHMSAANMVKNHDHEAAAEHLAKAGIHTQAAAKHYEAHSKHWIQKAIKHPGAFTKQAKKAHKSVGGMISSVKAHPNKFSSTTKHRAALANTLRKMHKEK